MLKNFLLLKFIPLINEFLTDEKKINYIYSEDLISNNIYIIKDFNESELKEIKEILNDLLNFLKSEKYMINFSEEFCDMKISQLRIAYTKIKDNGTLFEFDSTFGYILISEKLKNANSILEIMTIIFGLLQYIVDSGSARKHNEIRYGLNTIIMESLCTDYLEYFLCNSHEPPEIIEKAVEYMNDVLYDPSRTIKLLEMIYGKNLYHYYFTNNNNKLAEEFNNKVINNNNSYINKSPYTDLMDNIEYLISYYIEEKEYPYDKAIEIHKSNIHDLLSYALGKDIDKL